MARCKRTVESHRMNCMGIIATEYHVVDTHRLYHMVIRTASSTVATHDILRSINHGCSVWCGQRINHVKYIIYRQWCSVRAYVYIICTHHRQFHRCNTWMNTWTVIHMYGHKKKTTVSWTMVTPCGGVTMIYRGLY